MISIRDEFTLNNFILIALNVLVRRLSLKLNVRLSFWGRFTVLKFS